MGILSFFKGKKHAEKSKETTYKPTYEPMTLENAKVAVPPVMPELTETVIGLDGNPMELTVGKNLGNEGLCMVNDNTQYYHLIVGCSYKQGQVRIMTIKDAEKAGFYECMNCADEVRKLSFDD